MPEGPELHLASRFVNRVCKNKIFTGKVLKSPVHKSDDVEFEAEKYTISASSRGKEMMLFVTEIIRADNKKSMKDSKNKVNLTTEPVRILFRFGMSGKFEFTTVDDVHKHAHLKFLGFVNDGDPQMVLSYVDVRRFGRWQVGADWSKARGPDPMFSYRDFRSNVVNNLSESDFDRPICETLLNQRYFNGVGNYLRAEVLYRLQIPPFVQARSVLEGVPEEAPDFKPKKKTSGTEEGDLLHMCHTVMLEVVNFVGGGGYDPGGKSANNKAFSNWLRCYCKLGMSNRVDHNGRTVWFNGPAGPMVPKEGKSRTRKSKKRKSESKSSADIKEDTSESLTELKKKCATTKKAKSRTSIKTDSKQDQVTTSMPKATRQKSTKVKAKGKGKKINVPKEEMGTDKIKKQSNKTGKKFITEASITVPLRRSSRKITAVTNA